VYVVEMVWCK